jgi:hypothetical protein
MFVEFESDIVEWDARRADSWYFAVVPAELSADIREIPRPPRGFGSVRVRASIGATTWTTSIFPGSDGTYVLPLKKAVRTAEQLDPDGSCAVGLEILDA